MDAEEPLGLGMDFQLPDFSQLGRAMRLMAWLPAIMSAVIIFVLSFLFQVIYDGLTRPDYNITYGSFMMMVLVSLAAALIVGALVRASAGRKMKQRPALRL